ncbi:MAG: hypothetical protein J7J98_05530 [candidate division Zixibacteria bacterium]|nr:hypothetical protein [candidate division Zixibacteria bacterium]
MNIREIVLNKNQILIIDPDPLAQESLIDLLGEKHLVLQADSYEEALTQLSSSTRISAVILGINARFNDSGFLRSLRDYAPDIPLILHSGFPSVELDVNIPEFMQPYEVVRKSDYPNRIQEVLTSMLADDSD